MKKELVAQENQLAVQPQSLSMGGMLQAFIEKGVTSDNVAAFGQLIELQERLAARDAEKEFAQAFVSLQSEIPSVHAVKEVPNKDGSIRYRFAPYEEIIKTVQPLLLKHGFSVTFNMSFAEGRIKSICTLMHTGGHSRSNEFAVRIGGGPPGSSETQADGAAKTYAKRGALCDALNIVVSQTDDDANIEGAAITSQQAANLRERVKSTGSDEERFLAFAHASKYEDITESRFDALDEFLRKKELKNAKPIPKHGEREPGETGKYLF